jgi:ribosomal protein S26
MNPPPAYIRRSHISTEVVKNYAEHLEQHHTSASHSIPDYKVNECVICAVGDIMVRLAEERDDLQAAYDSVRNHPSQR